MATQAQTTANRLNAQHSTGPKFEAGIAPCRHNANRHGLTGKQIVVKGEDPAAYDALRLQLIAEYAPASEQEAMLVEEIAQSHWRLQRARRTEAEMLSQMDLIAAISEKPFLNLPKAARVCTPHIGSVLTPPSPQSPPLRSPATTC